VPHEAGQIAGISPVNDHMFRDSDAAESREQTLFGHRLTEFEPARETLVN
jgi:hypothetical protein